MVEIIESSSITVTTSENDSADELLQSVLDGLEQLVSCYTELFDVATAEGEQQIANYAADRMGVHKKSIWKLESTLA
jgi:DNA-binding ferritin-like protein